MKKFSKKRLKKLEFSRTYKDLANEYSVTPRTIRNYLQPLKCFFEKKQRKRIFNFAEYNLARKFLSAYLLTKTEILEEKKQAQAEK